MQTTSAEFQAAVVNPDRRPLLRLTVDLERDGSGNRIPDPGFEDGTPGASVAVWGLSALTYDTVTSMQYSTTQAYEGTQSAKVNWATTAGDSAVWIQPHTSLVVGKTYICSAWVYVPATMPAVRWGHLFTPEFVSSSTTGQWEFLTVEIEPTAADSVFIGLATLGATTSGQHAFLDDVRFYDLIEVGGEMVDPDDWSPYVTSARWNRSVNTDLPESTRLVTGYSAAEATITLAGNPFDNAEPASSLWSPYNVDSPYYGLEMNGAPATLEAGFETGAGPEYVPALTGRVRTADLALGNRELDLTLLDGAIDMSGPVDLPMVIGTDPIESGHDAGLNSQWIIDFVLRQGGHYLTPAIRPFCILSATLHGSMYPEVGTFVSADRIDVDATALGIPISFEQGQWGLAPHVPDGQFEARYTLASAGCSQSSGSAIVWSGWVKFDTAITSTPTSTWLVESTDVTQRVECNTAIVAGVPKLRAIFKRSGADAGTTVTSTLAISAGWHYIAMHALFTSNSAADIHFRVDDQTEIVPTVFGITVSSPPAMTLAEISGFGSCEAVQITTELIFDWNDDWEPRASLEPGLNDLIVMPPTKAPDAWALLKEIVGAEGGVLWFDESWQPVFWNRRHWFTDPAALTVQRTLSAAESLVDCSVVQLDDAVRNVIRVPYEQWAILPSAKIWTVSEKIKVDKRLSSSKHTIVWAQFETLVTDLDTSVTVMPSGAGSFSAYRAARQPNGGGGEVTNLTFTVEAFADKAKVTIDNVLRQPDAYLVSPSGAGYPAGSNGQPCLVLWGRPIVKAGASVSDDTAAAATDVTSIAEARSQSSIDHYGAERLYEVPTSPWRQSRESAQDYADDLLEALAWPGPQIQGVVAIGDPSSQLGDRVQLVDEYADGTAGPSGMDEPAWLVRVDGDFSGGKLSMSALTRPVARPLQLIWGVEGHNTWTVNTW